MTSTKNFKLPKLKKKGPIQMENYKKKKVQFRWKIFTTICSKYPYFFLEQTAPKKFFLPLVNCGE